MDELMTSARVIESRLFTDIYTYLPPLSWDKQKASFNGETVPPAQNQTKMKLAVLTSGGDSAGMNAVVRAVVKAGIIKYESRLPIFIFF